jgi:ATPase family associated with various cellular activities (AAA)/Winged helix domain, variant
MSGAPDIAPIAAAFPRLAALIGGVAPEPAPTTRADLLAARFGLDDFVRDVILLAAWAELEPEAATAIAARLGDARATAPTIGLALAALPGAHWSAFAAEAPLRAAGLITLGGAERVTARTYALPEAVLLFLIGADGLSEELATLARRLQPPATLSPVRERLRDELLAALRADTGAAIQLCGPDPAGKEAAAAAAAAALDRPLFAMPGGALQGPAAETAQLARLWRRELALMDGILLLEAESADSRATAAFAEAMTGPLILSGSDVLALRRRPSLRLDMARPKAAEQAPLWRAALGPMAKRLNGSLGRLAANFPIAPELMQTVSAELAAAPRGADLAAVAWNACRRRARPRMDDLAQRIERDAGWDDIVLPEPQMRALRAIAAQVRHRAQVYEDWGFGEKAGGRGLSVSALFSGPSGAGKTLAAEVLGTALDLDVYRIDLASVVSKWIGETEKNLRRVFDAADEGCAILLFDEADALFGKRSEVRDSHDRYANIEVSYLLQRLEAYRGLTILTTNLRSHIDEAFLRRLRFVIDFPFPSPSERAEIWARTFPPQTPTEGLDRKLLAQLNVVGGSIRNIALNAAFIAADRERPVGMAEVLAAARLEYEKAGRAMTDPELRGWPR